MGFSAGTSLARRETALPRLLTAQCWHVEIILSSSKYHELELSIIFTSLAGAGQCSVSIPAHVGTGIREDYHLQPPPPLPGKCAGVFVSHCFTATIEKLVNYFQFLR